MNKNSTLFLLLLVSLIITSFTSFKNDKLFLNTTAAESDIAVANIEAIATGDWNDASVWSNNQVPTSADDVVIPNGIRISLTGIMNANVVFVDGVLGPLNLTTDFDLTAKAVLVRSGGLFQVGSEANAYKANGLITLTGTNPAEVIPGISPFMGSKLIGALSGSRLELHGVEKKTWTQLNATALKGATSITLKETINWNVGDEIVIASTDFDPHQAEKRTITSINGTVVNFSTPLQYMHFGVEQTYNNGTKDLVLDERAEVGLLSHNLKIQGDASSENNGYGGHIMSMPNSISKGSNIELYRMGQKSQVGKYPWHWHLVGDADGQYIKNAGIHRSFNRVITVHATNNTVVEGNVGYDFLGHGYFLEDGNETGNLFKNNLGVLCKRPKVGEATRPHDLGIGADRGASPEAFPATFWITNPNNDFIGNVSAGSDGSGFWHLILDEVLDDNNSGYIPGNQPMGIFDDNKAHSNLFSWGIDGGIDKDTEEIVNGHYRPRNADGSQFIPIINRFDGYKSVDRNVWIRANTMDFYDCDFGDNGRADFFSYNQTLYNSLIVGKSANVGNPQSSSELEAGRSLPFPERTLNQFSNAFRGHSIYDGPSGIVDTHFAGFDLNGAKSYCFQINGASRKSTNHFARGITYDPSVDENAKFDFDHISYFSYMYLSGLIDEDGSLTGTAGTNVRPIIIQNPNGKNLYEKGANTQMTDVVEVPEWGAWLTQNKTYNYFKDIDFTDKTDAAFTPRYFITEYPDKSSHAVFNVQTQQLYFDAPVITNDLDYTYYFQYHKIPKYMSATLDGCVTNSENVIVAYPNIAGISYAGNANRVSTMAQLKASEVQAYLIKDNTVYFKLISTNLQSEFFQRQFGPEYRYETSAFICNAGNCFDSATWGDVINDVTLIDFGVRSSDLGSIETNNDSRDSAVATDGLAIPTLSYANTRVNFSVENNGNGIQGFTDYEITLAARQVWEYFNTLSLDYSGPNVSIIITSENGEEFDAGTYAASDSRKIRIGQDTEFNKFTNVKKVTLRFYESSISDLNVASTSNVSINSIKLGADVPDVYSTSLTVVNQDSDGDAILDSVELDSCRDPSSASDFALEFNGDSDIFDGYEATFIDDVEVINGVIKGRSNSNDPKIIKVGFLSFKGSDINSFKLRYKANASTRFQLFWQTNDNSNYAGSRSASAEYTGNGDWQELTLDVSSNAEFQDKIITGLRIDPTNNTNVSFEIDWLRANNAVDPAVACIPQVDNDGDGLFNKEEEDLCRDIDSASDFAIEFNGDDIFDGYNPQQLTAITEVNGTIKATSDGADPKLIKTDFLSMKGSEITSLQVRFKADRPTTVFQLLWANEDGGFAANRSISQTYTGNGEWQIITLDVSTIEQWNSKTITGFRIDPTNDSNTTFEIDWIRAQDAVDPVNACEPLSIRSMDGLAAISLYPNPTSSNGSINVRGLESYSDLTVEVYDLSGKQIKVIFENDRLKLSGVSAGIYFVRFTSNENETATRKLIVR